MRTLSRSTTAKQVDCNDKSRSKNSRWASRIHIERRNGLTSYVVTFTDGRLTATVRGAFSRIPVQTSVVRAEAVTAATDWLAHIRALPAKPRRRLRRLACPQNKQPRKHGFGRRAAV